jgi:hypothetical protein
LKLRIRDNSVRLRLTRGEVERLAREGRVASSIGFPGGTRLEYAIESAPGTAAPVADYAGDRVRVRVPESEVRAWAESDRVSIAGEQALGGDAALAILVEKDFECLTPRAGEDESDMFPHPMKDVESC